MPHPSERDRAASGLFAALVERIALDTGIEVERRRLAAVLEGLAERTDRDAGELERSLSPEDPLWRSLLEGIVTPETYFFRDEAQIRAIRDVILPEIADRRSGSPVRLWSAGCSTGEEAYTLAFLVGEALSGSKEASSGQVLGTDLSEAALEKARAGIYTRRSLRAMGEEEVERWLAPRGEGDWEIVESAREHVRFLRHNLVKDPLPDPGRGICAFDLILCRNVLQYLSNEAATRVVAGLGRCLAPGGYLIVAHVEADARLFEALEPVRLAGTIVHRRARSASVASPGGAGGGCQSVSADEGAPESWLVEGRDAADRGDRDRALSALRRAVEHAPLDTEARYLLAVLELEDGSPSRAESHLRRILLIEPNHLGALAIYARRLRSSGREREAADHLRRLRGLLEGREEDEQPGSAHGMTVADLREVLAAEERRCAATEDASR